jgi:rhodanese-related sulfurtransferase
MELTRITAEEANNRMDRGEPLTFIDARNADAWEKTAVKLPGAIRIPADETDQHLSKIPRDRAILTYCT